MIFDFDDNVEFLKAKLRNNFFRHFSLYYTGNVGREKQRTQHATKVPSWTQCYSYVACTVTIWLLVCSTRIQPSWIRVERNQFLNGLFVLCSLFCFCLCVLFVVLFKFILEYVLRTSTWVKVWRETAVCGVVLFRQVLELLRVYWLCVLLEPLTVRCPVELLFMFTVRHHYSLCVSLRPNIHDYIEYIS